MDKTLQCEQCTQTLDVGRDAIRVEEGVIGMRGFVPSDKTLFFCCERCLQAYYDLDGIPGLEPRIP